jgi:hypothetical protein
LRFLPRRLRPGGWRLLLGWTLEPPSVRNNGFKSGLNRNSGYAGYGVLAHRAAIDLAFARRLYCLGWHTPP